MRRPLVLRILVAALPLVARILGRLQRRTYATPRPMTAADWTAGRIAAALVAADTRHRIAVAAWRRRVTAEAREASERAAADDSAQWAEVWRQIAS